MAHQDPQDQLDMVPKESLDFLGMAYLDQKVNN